MSGLHDVDAHKDIDMAVSSFHETHTDQKIRHVRKVEIIKKCGLV